MKHWPQYCEKDSETLIEHIPLISIVVHALFYQITVIGFTITLVPNIDLRKLLRCFQQCQKHSKQSGMGTALVRVLPNRAVSSIQASKPFN